jgi:hypothetical protein
MEALGRLFNVVAAASGVHIPLENASGVTFVCADAASGDQVATIKESIDGGSEQALDVDINPYVGPDIGGTWAAVAEQDDTFDMAAGSTGTATNDTLVFHIDAAQLSDGFNCVEVAVDAGTCIAIIHDLTVQRAPANLASSVV